MKDKSIILGARAYSDVRILVWEKGSPENPILLRELLEQLRIEPEQVNHIFGVGPKGGSSWDQLGSIRLSEGKKFGELAKIIGRTIEVVRNTGMDNVISGTIWTCLPSGKVMESGEFPAKKYI